MATLNRTRRHAAVQIAVAAVAILGTSAPAAAGPADEPDISGVRVQVDNDLFAGSERDRDYTGGMAVTIAGRRARDGWLSLDPLLRRMDGLATPASAQPGLVRHARQIGLMVFTPADTQTVGPLPNDRPYASLLFLSNGRVRIDSDERGAWTSSLTVGVLGLSVTEQLHNAVHDLVGSESPQGYAHQISAGGEPTARYTLARHRLWIASPSGRMDVKTTVQGSAGFLTEASGAISLRVGRFDTPWWSFAPELTDYMAAPLPIQARPGGFSELYFFAGARLKVRAYSAFLQGQFRHSPVRYSADELAPLIAEAWIGVVTPLLEHTQLTYSLNYHTAEVRHGDAARDVLWGAVQVSHAF